MRCWLTTPRALPLAQGARYSENGQFIAIGDGLWGTASKIAMPGNDAYAARFADPASGTAGYWGLTNENGTKGVLALRVKEGGGKIGEIEAIDVREESQGPRGGTMTLMRPPLPVELKAASLGSLDPVFLSQKAAAARIPQTLITAYWDGLERHSSKDVRFTSECARRDNAVQASGSCAAQMDGNGTSAGLYDSHRHGARPSHPGSGQRAGSRNGGCHDRQSRHRRKQPARVSARTRHIYGSAAD